ncbi:MAG: hypothetical protein ACXWP5_08265 [Bdellovibrionota bacterium]
MVPLTITIDLRTTLQDAQELLLQALQSRNFSIISKVDVQSERSDANEGPRSIIIRALYPRLAAAGMQHLFDRVRCSAILMQIGEDRVRLELTKPTRLLNLQDSKVAEAAESADEKLREIVDEMTGIGLAEDPEILQPKTF